MAAPRQWAIFDKWDAGGFLAGGSFRAGTRYNSLNMQRYSNGSIGPRPGWRKLTMSADASSSVPATTSAANLRGGSIGWHPYAPSGWTRGALFFATHDVVGSACRRINTETAGSGIYFAGDSTICSSGGGDLGAPTDKQRTNAIQHLVQSSQDVWVSGQLYRARTNLVTAPTLRTISATVHRPSRVAIYKNRVYAWAPNSATLYDYIAYSSSTNASDFSGGDSGAFNLSGAINTNLVVPVGLWSLSSGLLIYANSSLANFDPTEYTTTNFGTAPEAGHWYILTGPSPSSGTLNYLGQDIGPIDYFLGIVKDNKLLFPMFKRGWAVHDGSRLDKDSLSDLRPGRGFADLTFTWYNPAQTFGKAGLVLPFNVTTTDPTAATTSAGASVGEFYNTGLGAFEYVNGAWTEHLYNHGQSDFVGVSNFEHDKLAMIHAETIDGGATYRPQLYTRDVTLDRPATTTNANTNNQFSSSTETATTGSGGRTGLMYCRLETGEFVLPNYMATKPAAIIVDYDYWNSSDFDTGCGFDVDFIYRDITSQEKTVVRANQAPITPPGTSTGLAPKRARAVLNLPYRVATGTFQVRLDNIVGCAIHAVAVAHDPEDSAAVR